MSKEHIEYGENFKGRIKQYYNRLAILILTAIILSAVIIIYFNNVSSYDYQVFDVYNSLEIAAVTLLPYMISAVVAAITAIGIMTILPLVKSIRFAHQIQLRLRKMAEGDLSDKLQIEIESDYWKDIAYEINNASGYLGGMIAKLKIINRQQWNLLELIRQASLNDDSEFALKMIEKMEENWYKIAEIESKLKT
ncbi:MAG: hypothetical protein GXO93_06215 [FCB group bacterium]|nr:hypothetical protein [FCB group bacterium]